MSNLLGLDLALSNPRHCCILLHSLSLLCYLLVDYSALACLDQLAVQSWNGTCSCYFVHHNSNKYQWCFHNKVYFAVDKEISKIKN